ncbi:SusC/RagA family TonB-linked outer membrane protein [Zobellia uliginosa]|uniref:SusC/RagA family TonB-linked outer membrane protein n=1 Tax=Zobellia uliginosa TaxID=143224 RepID=UPI001C07785F|nr:SusC/RagA family TonB-linked outer membrane protein [Zobellia uliginosa]MBU2946822.1 SusC/RagA family TonB-linked outer membrane protein [Zobellia uliginosa]
MMKNILMFLVLIMGTHPILAQDKTVTGTVTDANDGMPLPGVNVLVQGSTTGTQTDFDGNYAIEATSGDVLIFSYIGMKSQNVTVGASSTIDLGMQEDASQLDEVVVTALGIKRQKKSLTYATQGVDTKSIDEARPQQDLVNSLQGKVAGLSIQTSGNGVSGSSKVVLRGNRSIAGSSQALYVVDGVPLGGDISNLSPDDIASINVLKGANAAALYGARANNGAIIVTTKTGTSDVTTIDFSSTLTADTGRIMYDYQNEYGQGSGGLFNNSSTGSWGPRMDGSSVANWSPSPDITSATPYTAQPNNVTDFMQTGFNMANNVSIRSGNDKNRTFFGYTNENRKGIVAGNELKRHNVTLKIDNKLFNDKLELSAKANYIRTETDNILETGESFANPWRHAYRLPRNIRTSDAEVFEYLALDGSTKQNYWKPKDNGGANPYWTTNRNLNNSINNRVIGYASLKYNILDNLSLMVRTAVDNSTTFREDIDYNDTYVLADNGNYETRNSIDLEWNSDFLLSYNKQVNDDFNFNINFGGNSRMAEDKYVSTNNQGLNAPNIFAISNALNLASEQDYNNKKVNSLYTFGQVGYKDALFLDLTYRSDWSSTLPVDNNRFDYYSAGLSAVISDLVKLPEVISYLKLRGSYAEVGNDTDPYRVYRNASNVPLARLKLDDALPNTNLKPERTQSLEFGVDARFLDNRLGIDLTYYKSNSIDQLFPVSVDPAFGFSTRFVNGGDIQNKGVEAILTGTPIQTNDFSWNVSVNFSKNESEVLSLSGGLETLILDAGNPFFRQFELEIGEPWGNMYSRGFERDDQNRVIVNADGTPSVTAGKSVLIGNYNPDWLGGISNSFRYKNLSLSFLIDIRQGGVIGSLTNAILASDGALDVTTIGRDGTLVFGDNVFGDLEVVKADGTPNDIQTDAETFWASIGGRNAPVGEAFVEDASNIRMREITLGYSLPSSLIDRTPFRNIKLTLVGRNLFFFSNSASVDPEVIVDPTLTSADGYESFSPPSTRSLGLNLKFGF